MSVLVAAASKYGATAEIAKAIGDVLVERGIQTDILPVEDVTAVDGFDAVVLGSAAYAGRWLKPAKELVEAQAAALAARPVWLFSSGPAGDPLKPEEDPADAAPMLEATGAVEHRVFPGKIDKSRMNFAEKAMVMALRVPEGDYRDWDQIRAWASGIADRLLASSES